MGRERGIGGLPDSIHIGSNSVGIGGLQRESAAGACQRKELENGTISLPIPQISNTERNPILTFSLFSFVVFLILKKTSFPSVETILMFKVLPSMSQKRTELA